MIDYSATLFILRSGYANSASTQDPMIDDTDIMCDDTVGVGDPLLHLNQAADVESPPRVYIEILELPGDSPQVGAYEEICNTVADCSSV